MHSPEPALAKTFPFLGSIILVSLDGGAAAIVWCGAHSSLIYPELSCRGCLLMDQDVIVKKNLPNLLSLLEFLRRSKNKIWDLVTPTLKKKVS